MHGHGRVARRAGAVEVHVAERRLRHGIAGIGGLAQQSDAAGGILGDAAAEQMEPAQRSLGGDVAVVAALLQVDDAGEVGLRRRAVDRRAGVAGGAAHQRRAGFVRRGADGRGRRPGEQEAGDGEQPGEAPPPVTIASVDHRHAHRSNSDPPVTPQRKR